jgi:hypothetical protein
MYLSSLDVTHVTEIFTSLQDGQPTRPVSSLSSSLPPTVFIQAPTEINVLAINGKMSVNMSTLSALFL